MCGIWAIFGSRDAPHHLQACLRLAHRGPDAFRLERLPHYTNCYLGFHRLTIMDDLYGMQPMQIRARPHVWLIYTGEIYNHLQLQSEFGFEYETQCDGEVMLHLYHHHGIEFMAKHLDGVFAFCLVDTDEHQVYIGRDTIGVRPEYKLYCEASGFLAVATEAKGLTDVLPLNDMRSIQQLSPGHVETYHLSETGTCTFQKSTAFHKFSDVPMYKSLVPSLGDDVYTNVRQLFRAAVKKRIMSHRRVGCLLSGGLDSSLVCSLVCECAKEAGLPYKIQSFSVGMEGSPDLKAARQVAEHLQTEHHEVMFTAEEGLSILPEVVKAIEMYDHHTVRSAIGMYLLTRYIREKTDTVVILAGEGADELMQGYAHYHTAPSIAHADEESRRNLDQIHLMAVLRADRIPSAHGLEIRVPFLDHHLMAYFLSLPADQRVPRDGVEKYIIRKAFQGTGVLPDNILWRPKVKFSDGMSSEDNTWADIMAQYAQQRVSDAEMADAAVKFPYNTPQEKESYLLRQIFQQLYPGCDEWTPSYWQEAW